MATGLYVSQDGFVMVAYGTRNVPISSAQYRANGYKPVLEKLNFAKSLTAQKPRARPACAVTSPGPKVQRASSYSTAP
jgi:hypothetical protein